MATTKAVANVIGIKLPIVLSSIRYRVDGAIVQAVDVPGNRFQQDNDFPTATHKLYSYARDPAQWYVLETVVTDRNGIGVTHTFPPDTGASDSSPNIPRNIHSGKFDEVNYYLVPTPVVPPVPPG